MALAAELLAILVLILANGFFAAAEIAILTARPHRLEQAAQAGSRRARIALALAADPNRFLPTVQVGITLVGTLAAVFGGARIVEMLDQLLAGVPLPALARYREPIAMGIVVVGISYFSLVLGELVPKRLALGNAEGLARVVAPTMQRMAAVARPFVWLMGLSTNAILYLFGRRQVESVKVSIEDIEHLLKTGIQTGVLEPAEQAVARKALHLGDRRVRDIVRPRVEMESLDVDTPPDEVIGAIAMAGFSRLPVYQEDVDHILGFIFVKDVLRQIHLGWPVNVRKMIRPALFVPESMTVDRLLERFQKKRTQMAIVLDEYGGTEGLVTLEDVLEELIGEIHDEHRDDHSQMIVRRDDGSWLVDGSVSLSDLLRTLGLERLLPDRPRPYSSVGGLVFSQLNRIPRVGDRIEWNGLRLEIVDMDGPRIDRLLVAKAEAGEGKGGVGEGKAERGEGKAERGEGTAEGIDGAL